MGYGVWGVLGVWCGAGRAGNDWGVVYPITSFDNFWEKVCVRGTINLTSFWDKVYPITSFDNFWEKVYPQ